jgi:hypothetical protein
MKPSSQPPSPRPAVIFQSRPKLLICEICDARVLRKEWPEGWSCSGRSRFVFREDIKSPVVSAAWCPLHHDSSHSLLIGRVNPTEGECRKIFNSLDREKCEVIA